MHAHILAIGTAVPKYTKKQTEVPKQLKEIFQLDNLTYEKIQNIYAATLIDKRHSVIKDFTEDCFQGDFFGNDYPKTEPSTKKRNDFYIAYAPTLAIESANNVLKKWGGDKKLISHVIFVSCTGMMAPGVEFDVMETLNLSFSVERFGLNFMGCFGAIKGLKIAAALSKENPKNRVLLICTELCSLHYQKEQTLENIISNSLFSDGSAACIIGCSPTTEEKSLWSIEKTLALAIPNTKDEMAWKTGDSGLIMKLTKKVPISIYKAINSFVTDLLASYSLDICDFPIHPGGKAILQAIQKALRLSDSDLSASFKTLWQFGSMSSPTFLFVLNELLQQKRKPKAIGVAFGPGLSLEGILLHNEALE